MLLKVEEVSNKVHPSFQRGETPLANSLSITGGALQNIMGALEGSNQGGGGISSMANMLQNFGGGGLAGGGQSLGNNVYVLPTFR